MNGQFWWFMARGSGIVAWLMLTASVLWGIVLSSGAFPKHRRPAWLLDLHRWLGGLTLAFVAVHVASLIADSYVSFSLVDVLVPFAADWKPIPVAGGVIAFWGLVAVQLTSLAMKRLPRRVWRSIHLTSYLVFWLSSLHGTFAGSDSSNRLYVATSVITVVAVVLAATHRSIRYAVPRRRRSGSAARARVPQIQP